MRHRRLRGKLGVKTNHRKALLRNLVRSLVQRKRIKTTLAKAKVASSFADTVVEIAKRGDLHARRLLIARLGCAETAHTLITQVAPKFKDRQGAYTRVLRVGTRHGDGGEVALLEFTATIEAPEKPKKPKKSAIKKSDPSLSFGGEKAHEEKKPAKGASKEKAEEKEKTPEKKESEKKGGFLGALRRFLKGDEEKH